MRCFWLSLLGFGLLMPAGCEGEKRRRARAVVALDRPATQSALELRAIRAIRDGNVVAYVALLATASEVRRACPERFAGRELAETRKKWQQSLASADSGVKACHALIDWKRARRVSRKGGRRRGPIKLCKEQVWRLTDITMEFATGQARYRVVLRKPYQRGTSVFGFSEGPRCRKISSK